MGQVQTGLRSIVQKIRNRTTQAIPVKPRYLKLNAPIASFTFDDFAASAWRTGGRFVEGFGGRATYYVAGGLCGQLENGIGCFEKDDLLELVRRGHDVGCHSYDHVPVPGCTAKAILESLSKNHEFLKEVTGKEEMTSFAYPLGLASLRTKHLLSGRYLVCRGIYPGVNAGWMDCSQLNAICLDRADLPIEKYIQQALRRNGWLIFVGHDVSEWPGSFGCTPQFLERTLRLVSDAGIKIVTVDTALQKIFE